MFRLEPTVNVDVGVEWRSARTLSQIEINYADYSCTNPAKTAMANSLANQCLLYY